MAVRVASCEVLLCQSLKVIPVSRWAKGDLRRSFRFNIRFDMDLRGRSGGVYPRSGLRIELRREVDNGFVIGFGFENVCSDESRETAGSCHQAAGRRLGRDGGIDRRV
jgi:hypothetical protein